MDRVAPAVVSFPLSLRKWHLKAACDGLKALVPFQQSARRLKRRFFPYQTLPDRDCELVEDARDQLVKLARLGISIRRARVVEIGTGWNPVLPLLLRLCGAESVITVDRERLLDAATVRTGFESVRRYRNLFEAPLAAAGLSPDFDALAARSANWDRALGDCAIDYRAPADVRELPGGMADIVISRDVLEHVPPAALDGVMGESHRILKDGGAICHKIDMTDHWEHEDKSISPVNFLQYDGLGWKLAGLNPQNYQNRMRRFEFVELAKRHGFELIAADGEPDQRAMAALRSMNVIRRYAGVPHEELAVLHVILVARKTRAA